MGLHFVFAFPFICSYFHCVFVFSSSNIGMFSLLTFLVFQGNAVDFALSQFPGEWFFFCFVLFFF